MEIKNETKLDEYLFWKAFCFLNDLQEYLENNENKKGTVKLAKKIHKISQELYDIEIEYKVSMDYFKEKK